MQIQEVQVSGDTIIAPKSIRSVTSDGMKLEAKLMFTACGYLCNLRILIELESTRAALQEYWVSAVCLWHFTARYLVDKAEHHVVDQHYFSLHVIRITLVTLLSTISHF